MWRTGKKSIPDLIMAAASCDDVVAISGFSVAIAFALPPAEADTCTTVLVAFHGPLTILIALVAGTLGGLVAAATHVWDRPWKRTAIVAFLGAIYSFGAKQLEEKFIECHNHPVSASAGILSALCMAGVASYCWERGYGVFSAGPDDHHAHAVESHLALVWTDLAQPLLFGIVGIACRPVSCY